MLRNVKIWSARVDAQEVEIAGSKRTGILQSNINFISASSKIQVPCTSMYRLCQSLATSDSPISKSSMSSAPVDFMRPSLTGACVEVMRCME